MLSNVNKTKLRALKFNFISYIPTPQRHSLSRQIHSTTKIHKQQEQHFNTCGYNLLSNHPNPEISCFHLKGFSQITKETTGRALHALCITGLAHLNVFCTNTLVAMYSKFGAIESARYLFDKMPDKNQASWNTMVSGYVKVGFYYEGVGLFGEMMRCGIGVSGIAVSSAVTGCDRSGCMYDEGVQLNGVVVKFGLLSDVFVGTSLLHFYGTYGRVLDVGKLFVDMPERNVVSWSSLMFGYLDNGKPWKVVGVYQDMRREGVSCNQNTYTTIVTSCGLIEDKQLGYQVLGDVLKSGFESEVSVANSLVSMFGNFGCMKQARAVFDIMDERDIISWNSMISASAHNNQWEESLRYFNLMRHFHGKINSTTLSSLLSVCGSADAIKWGMGTHGLVIKFGLDLVVCVCNTLLSMYSGAGRSNDAELVFQNMPERDLITWNSMMACYVQDEKCIHALKLLAEMQLKRKEFNYVTLTSALAACSSPVLLAEGKSLHALAILAGFQHNLVVGNALISMYAKNGMMATAKDVFHRMPMRDGVTWNALIGGHAENEESTEAVEAFKLMREEGALTNYITIVNVLGACLISDNLLQHGMPMHAYIIHSGFGSDNFVQNSLITMYAKCGDLNSSIHIFDDLPDKNAATWNTIIMANARHDHGEEALRLLVKMRTAGFDLDCFSFCAGLAAAANLALLEEGQQLHCLAVKFGIDSDSFVTNAAMDMYGKCGEMDDVLNLFPHPENCSRLSWNILISSFAKHGHFQKAIQTFEEMIKWDVKPDHVTFVCLLSACSHGGLVDEGLSYYASMTKDFSVNPAIEHCVCIIDLLGRAGRLVEAESFIENMPVQPNDLLWRSLLAACRIHGNLVLGNKAAKHLLQLAPSDDSAYVLHSNIFATTGKWEDVESIRYQMGSKRIKKQPACSWLKLKTSVNSFGMGDRSHPQAKQIYAKLVELRRIIKEAGYVPDTNYALHDTDEEQKENNLWTHSERLALAFGLINCPEGSTIKIFKNLRVCGDCHSVYKLASGIVGRKIILRDSYRFHHFSEGKCSCSDYW